MTIAALLIAAVLLLLSRSGPLRERCPELVAAKSSERSQRRTLAQLLAASGVAESARRLVPGRKRTASAQELLDAAAALDLLSSSLRAGLPLAKAMHVVSTGCAPTLRETFSQCAHRLTLGGNNPWESFAAQPALVDVAIAARRSAQSGTALMKSFEETAATARERAADAGEAVAERAGVLIAGPLALCFLPAFVTLGLVPTIAGLADSMFEGLLP